MAEFLPNLRAAFGNRNETKTLTAAIESKSLAIAGYESVTAIGGHAGIMFTSATRADGWDMERAVTEYERSVWAYRCIELISTKAARLAYAAAKDRDTDEAIPLDASEAIFRVLNKRANPLEVGRAFKKRQSAQVLLSKKGVFVEVGKTQMGTMNRLDLMDPSRVTIDKSTDGTYIKQFQYLTRNGEVKELTPERVRWIREPHPLDEFSGTTPLEAAGLSVQMDMLSRLWNVSFIQNDARPGGILAVNADTLNDQEMDRLERKFLPGAHHAGELEVIASGPNGLNYIDTTTRPRDMAYSEAAQNAKEEVLAAFGIGESVLGNASGRTFDNADAELYNFWTGVMADHLELIASAYDEDIPEEYDGYFDTSKVPALALPEIKAREEARTEVQQGLRTVDEYRPLAKLDTIDIPQTRALWLSPAKAPVPTRPEDAAALGLEATDGSGAPPADGAPTEDLGTPQDAVEEARALNGEPLPGSPEEAVQAARMVGEADPDGEADEAAQAVEEARNAVTDPSAKQRATTPREVVQEARMEGKALDQGEPVTFDVGAQAAAATELTIATALDSMLARQSAITATRVDSPKIRQGTKFWTAAYEGDTRANPAGELDVEKIVQGERWTDQLTETLGPILMAESSKQAELMYGTLEAAGLIASAVTTEKMTAAATAAATRPVLEALSVAHEAMTEFLLDVARVIIMESAVAATTEVVAAKVREHYAHKAGAFARSLATSLAGMVLNGTAENAADMLAPAPGFDGLAIVKTWRGIPDSRIRDSHREATGQTVGIGATFSVGGAPLRYPNDPEGPPSETRGCRCRIEYRFAAGTRLLLPAI